MCCVIYLKHFKNIFLYKLCPQIWGVTVPTVLQMLLAEHAKSSFFKNIGPGVTQLHIDSHARLFSCGADGSMKVRQLPERDVLLAHHLK